MSFKHFVLLLSTESLQISQGNMRAYLPLLFGQNQAPANHAKLLFTIGIPSDLRSAYYIKI
jgi:hypothetical protein